MAEKITDEARKAEEAFAFLGGLDDDAFREVLEDAESRMWSYRATARIACLVCSRTGLPIEANWRRFYGKSVVRVQAFYRKYVRMDKDRRPHYLRGWTKKYAGETREEGAA